MSECIVTNDETGKEYKIPLNALGGLLTQIESTTLCENIKSALSDALQAAFTAGIQAKTDAVTAVFVKELALFKKGLDDLSSI